MSSSSILEILGPPEDISRDRKWPIWKYGSVELFFWEDHLNMIFIYFWNLHKLHLPKGLYWEGWAPQRETTIEDFQRQLRDIGAEYRTDPSMTFNDQVCLAVGAAMRVLFERFGERTLMYSLSIVEWRGNDSGDTWKPRAVEISAGSRGGSGGAAAGQARPGRPGNRLWERHLEFLWSVYQCADGLSAAERLLCKG